MEEIKNFQIKEVAQWVKEINFDIPHNVWNAKFEERIKKYQKELIIPGFRKGKSPISLIKVKYGKLIREEIERELIEKYIDDLNKEKELHMIMLSVKYETNLNDNNDLSVHITYEENPDFTETVKYEGFKLFAPQPYDDEMINKVIEKVLVEEETFVEKDDDFPIENGDKVLATVFTDKTDSNENVERVSEEIEIVIGNKLYGEEFDNMLIGKKTNDELIINKLFVDDADDVEHIVRIDKILYKKPAELTEEILQKHFKYFDKDINLDNYREILKTGLNKALDDTRKSTLKEQADAWLATYNFSLMPSTLVSLELKNQEKKLDFNFEKLDNNAKNNVWSDVNRLLLLDYLYEAIAKKENITVSKDEIDDFIKSEAEKHNVDFTELRREYIQSKNYEKVKDVIRYTKVTDLIIEKSDVIMVPSEEIEKRFKEEVDKFYKEKAEKERAKNEVAPESQNDDVSEDANANSGDSE